MEELNDLCDHSLKLEVCNRYLKQIKGINIYYLKQLIVYSKYNQNTTFTAPFIQTLNSPPFLASLHLNSLCSILHQTIYQFTTLPTSFTRSFTILHLPQTTPQSIHQTPTLPNTS